jgi:preprotein translocase subunit SecE
VSRESRRDKERFERRAEQEAGGDAVAPQGAAGEVPGKSGGRTSPRQYVGEVRSELRRVHWPDRKQLVSYSIVVLVAVALLTAYIFGIDQAFGQFALWMFG